MLFIIINKYGMLTLKTDVCQDAARTGSAADWVVAVFDS